jgi:tRNA threonylcarbamoyladenosine biosynthesis protein TsaE
MRMELAAATADDTRAIGGALAPLLRPGDAVALAGELGAGKTTLVQGVARGLGFEGAVASPTFTLVREYRTPRMTVLHADVYRLERFQEVVDLGLQELLDEDGILLVEWGDAVEALLPDDHLVVELTVPGDGEDRVIAIRPVGVRWIPRWERLEQALERWRTGG